METDLPLNTNPEQALNALKCMFSLGGRGEGARVELCSKLSSLSYGPARAMPLLASVEYFNCGVGEELARGWRGAERWAAKLG